MAPQYPKMSGAGFRASQLSVCLMESLPLRIILGKATVSRCWTCFQSQGLSLRSWYSTRPGRCSSWVDDGLHVERAIAAAALTAESVANIRPVCTVSIDLRIRAHWDYKTRKCVRRRCYRKQYTGQCVAGETRRDIQ